MQAYNHNGANQKKKYLKLYLKTLEVKTQTVSRKYQPKQIFDLASHVTV